MMTSVGFSSLELQKSAAFPRKLLPFHVIRSRRLKYLIVKSVPDISRVYYYGMSYHKRNTFYISRKSIFCIYGFPKKKTAKEKINSQNIGVFPSYILAILNVIGITRKFFSFFVVFDGVLQYFLFIFYNFCLQFFKFV